MQHLTFTFAFLLLLLLGSSSAEAQKLRFTDTTNTWYCIGNAAECGFDRTAVWGSDLEISGMHYRQLNYEMIHLYPGCSSSVGIGTGILVREDTSLGMVFYRNPSIDTAEHILFDYNLLPGDTIKATPSATDSVISVDSVLILGVYHKTFDLMGKAGDTRKYTVIEGIGCTANPVFPAFFGGCFEFSENLRCYKHDGVAPAFSFKENGCFSSGAMFANCSTIGLSATQKTVEVLIIGPNPASQEITIRANGFRDALSINIYDLTGRIISHHTIAENQNMVNIATGTWPNGTYLVRTSSEKGFQKNELIVISH